MITQEKINRGGSKLEITRALIEKDFKHVPESIFLYSGQDLSSIKHDFEKLLRKGLVICKGSHPNDYHGFVDVVPTRRNIESFSELEKAVKYAEEFMQKPEVRSYSELNDGQSYNPAIHFLIQQQSESQFLGQLLEHPHKKKDIFGNFYDVNDIGGVPSIVSSSSGEVNIAGCDKKELGKAPKKLINEIIPEMKSLDILNRKWSQNYEVSGDGLILQARPFKKFKKPKKWKIRLGDLPHFSFWECFGITQKTGINLPNIVKSFGIHNDIDIKDNKKYALTIEDDFMSRCSTSLNVKFENLVAYCTKQYLQMTLRHAHYRLMKKAQYSFFRGIGYKNGECDMGMKRKEILNEDNLTFFSNGKEGAIVPTKYLK